MLRPGPIERFGPQPLDKEKTLRVSDPATIQASQEKTSNPNPGKPAKPLLIFEKRMSQLVEPFEASAE
jgi:hypothetical protein